MIVIYKITNPIGQIYIGQTVDFNKRIKLHKMKAFSDKNKICISFQQHGFDSHIFEVIEECDVSELNTRERYWQDFYNATGDNGLNSFLTKTEKMKGVMNLDIKNKISKKNIEHHQIKRRNRSVCYQCSVRGPIKPTRITKMLVRRGIGLRPVKTKGEIWREFNKERRLASDIRKDTYRKNIEMNCKGGKNIIFDTYTGVFYNSISNASFALGISRMSLNMYFLGRRKKTEKYSRLILV